MWFKAINSTKCHLMNVSPRNKPSWIPNFELHSLLDFLQKSHFNSNWIYHGFACLWFFIQIMSQYLCALCPTGKSHHSTIPIFLPFGTFQPGDYMKWISSWFHGWYSNFHLTNLSQANYLPKKTTKLLGIRWLKIQSAGLIWWAEICRFCQRQLTNPLSNFSTITQFGVFVLDVESLLKRNWCVMENFEWFLISHATIIDGWFIKLTQPLGGEKKYNFWSCKT